MKLYNKEKLAYLAGLIDGEGCITISRRKKEIDKRKWAKSDSFFPRLEIVNTDYRLMKFLLKEFGGKIYTRKITSSEWKIAYDWKIAAVKLFEVIKQVLPYLIIKKKQAQLVIKFQEHMNKVKSQGSYTHSGVKKKNIKFRMKIWSNIKKLNQRGIE